jgi:hypothetical protein
VSPRGKLGHGARRLWLLWVLANAIGEAAGLGLTALVGAVAISSVGEGSGALATLGMAALACRGRHPRGGHGGGDRPSGWCCGGPCSGCHGARGR